MPANLDSLLAASILALLGFACVTCTLATLAARLRGQKFRHNLVVESRRRRNEYLAALEAAQGLEETPAADAPTAEPERLAA